MPPTRSPIRLAVVNDYAIIVMGLAALLEPYRDRVVVVEIDASLPVQSEVDLILYDTFGQVQGARLDVAELTRHSQAKVVVFSWNRDEAVAAATMARGAAAYLSKSLSAEELVAALEEVMAGGTVLREGSPAAELPGETTWPGRDVGLTGRESEIVALITQGLSNQEIAQRSYLSINSVKTYIRTAYRKMGVTRRSQAVLWGIQHGFEPDAMRQVSDPA